MLHKLCITLFILMTLGLSNPSSAATLPLNTGYDYSSWTTYTATANDNYWIRIASYPPVMPSPVGPSWAVANNSAGAPWTVPMAGPAPNFTPSMWINAFGPTAASPPLTSSIQYPFYAIFRKCFCLPAGFTQPSIQGSVRNDDSIQMWLNTQQYPVLLVKPKNITGVPHAINYTVQSNFWGGRNCLYALVEDWGGHTGFDLAANVNVTSINLPTIATGPNQNCYVCGLATTAAMKKMETEDEEVIKQIVKLAEERRLKRTKEEK